MKVKKLLSMLAAAAMTVTAFTGAMSVSAADIVDTGECGSGITWTLDSDGELTISGQGKMASPDVNPNNFKDEFTDFYTYKKHKDNIKKVIIEKGVTSVGYNAFMDFTNIETVSIPSTVTEFTEFRATSALQNNSFSGCTSLRNLTLEDGMTALGHRTFFGCTSLESVDIPSSITEWGDYTFSGCTSLKNITLHDGLKILGGGAFQRTAVENIYIPSTIETWDGTSDYTGSGVGAFQECEKLKSITFGDGLKTLGGGMKNIFYKCTSLEEVAFGDDSQLTSIASGAFENCTALKRIEIPDNVTELENVHCFNSCSAIESIYIYSKNVSIYNLPYKNENVKVYCYTDSVAYNGLIKEGITPYDISNVISIKLEELNTAVAEAEKYPENDYTAESYGKLKALLDEAATKDNESHIIGMEYLTEDIYMAIKGLEKKPPEDNTSGKGSDPSNSQQQTPNKTTPQTPTTARPTKSTRSAAQVKKDKSAAKKAMKQAKITKLTAKSKAKKKIIVSWKKVKNAKGYQVQVSAKKNFNKVIYNKSLAKNKLTIKSSKIKSKKTYYVRVRAYATYKDANNATKKIYSKWVKKIRKVKVK